MHLGFVVPLNTMTNSCCFNTGFVGNEKDLALLAPGEFELCLSKTFVLHMSAESYEQASQS